MHVIPEVHVRMSESFGTPHTLCDDAEVVIERLLRRRDYLGTTFVITIDRFVVIILLSLDVSLIPVVLFLLEVISVGCGLKFSGRLRKPVIDPSYLQTM